MNKFIWVVQVTKVSYSLDVRWVTTKTMDASYTNLFTKFKQQDYNISIAVL